MDTIARVRRAFHVQGWSVKKIARELNVSRNTVRKIVRSDVTEFTYKRERQPPPRIGAWRGDVERLLIANEGKASRERLTLIRIYEEVRALGYLPFAQAGPAPLPPHQQALRAHLDHRHHEPCLRRMAVGVR